MRQEVAVATVTWARDAQEDALIRGAISRLSDHGFPIAVADGGSPPGFIDFVGGLPNVTMVRPRERGLVRQVQAAVTAARDSRAPFILYTESDKAQFFQTALTGFLARAARETDAALVIASRSTRALSTFPPRQRFTESTFNTLCSESLRLEGDYLYGPFLVREDLLDAVATLTSEVGWGWRPFLFAVAKRRGCRIVVLEGDYECPADQRQEDDSERLHRLKQLGENVTGLVKGMTVPLETPR